MGNELERRAVPSIEESFRIAKGFAMSGYFQDAATAEKAFVKIMAGAEMGLAPFQSMKGIDIIKGNPFLKPALLRGLLDKSTEYDYEIAWEDDACTVSIFKNGKHRGDSRFSMEDAVTAGLADRDSYQKFERNMLLERATSNAVRWYAAGLTMGPVFILGEEVSDVLPPHIQALDEQAAASKPVAFTNQTSDLVAKAREMLDATEQVYDADEDLPFEVAAPADPHAAESQVAPGQIAAEPAAGTGGGLHIDSVDAAARFIRALSDPQKKALKALVGITGTTTNTALAARLYDQRPDWYAEDILRELK